MSQLHTGDLVPKQSTRGQRADTGISSKIDVVELGKASNGNYNLSNMYIWSGIC